MTAAGFDPELYLRLLGERCLMGPDLDRVPFSLTNVASAFVVVCGMDRDRAQAVVDDYVSALMLRRSEVPWTVRRWTRRRGVAARRPAGPPSPARPPEIAGADGVLGFDGGLLTIRHVLFGDHATTIAVTYDGAGPSDRHQFPRGETTVCDDQGTSAIAHQTHGSSDGFSYTGRFVTSQPLSPTTKWLDFAGARIALHRRVAVSRVTIEQMTDPSLARRYLWQCLATDDHDMGHDWRSVADALVAAGVLDPDDEVRTALDVVQGAQRVSSTVMPRPRLPDEWQALLRRSGRGDGPAGTALLGVHIPDIDGAAVTLHALDSSADDFVVEAEVIGGSLPGPFDAAVGPPPLAWWARDDRGNRYLGKRAGSSSDGTRADLRLVFRSPLDPVANRLHLMPTGLDHRAIVEIYLPWRGEP